MNTIRLILAAAIAWGVIASAGAQQKAPATAPGPKPAAATGPRAVPAPKPDPKPASAPADANLTILEAAGPWRSYNQFRPPMLQGDGEPVPYAAPASWLNRQDPAPPADWKGAEFDDRRWTQGPAFLNAASSNLGRLCLRGKFTVTDPGAAGLALDLAFQGGAAIYVNGQEVARDHLDKGKDLADAYPAEAFQGPGGEMLTFETNRALRAGDPKLALRVRRIEKLAIPPQALRKGLNVLAVELVHAPYPAAIGEKKDPKAPYADFPWNTCALVDVRLTASGPGAVSSARRPEGLRVWNASVLASDYTTDFGNPAEGFGPIEIRGARGGVFSGKIIVGSNKPIRGLKATAEDLKGPVPAPRGSAVAGATIPAAQVRIRYGLPWGFEYQVMPYAGNPTPWPSGAEMFGCLADAPPAEVPVRVPVNRTWPRKESSAQPGAVVPIWITVRVPADAKAGRYSGALTIEAEGEKPIRVPVELTVADWTIHAPQDHRAWAELIQSPDTLAMEYKAPLWSDKHFDLIGQSFKLLADSGSRIVYVPLICEDNQGHAETMVRWIKKGESQYEFDFTPMEKYLDAAEKNLGPPKIIVLYAWEVYMLQKGKIATGAAHAGEQENIFKVLQEKGVDIDKGPIVTVLDPATGKTENVMLPKYGEAPSKALWQGLYAELLKRMKARGREKALMFGMINDAWPTKEEVAFLNDLLPGTPWVAHAHFGAGPSVYGIAPTGYTNKVWAIEAPGERGLTGWNRPDLLARYNRAPDFDANPISAWRNYGEYCIAGNQRGVGRLGADFWKVILDKQGDRAGRIYARYPHANWRNLDIYTSLLAPAPQGPAATPRYVNLVEGLQECEARIFLEKTLGDAKLQAALGEDLARRCRDCLEDRLRCMELAMSQLVMTGGRTPAMWLRAPVASHAWFLGSGWEDRAAGLFTLVGEVERKLANR